MMSIFNNFMVVLDLDDTIYPEIDYVRSGLKFLIANLESWRKISLDIKVDTLLSFSNPIDALVQTLKLPDSVKESLLWMYRLHKPNIVISRDAEDLLSYCRKRNINMAIVTDGRLVTQSLKLEALQLTDIKSYISEEYGKPKPSPCRFLRIQEDFPGEQYLYIGDNPHKDFIAPNKLGWKTVGVRYRKENIHVYGSDILDPTNAPSLWVDDLTEIIELILEVNK